MWWSHRYTNYGNIDNPTINLTENCLKLRLCQIIINIFYWSQYYIYILIQDLRVMLHKESDNFMNRVRHALTLPIRTRCAELTVLFDRGSTLELQSFFPLLIDNIFGPQGTLGWGLRSTDMSEGDFRQLQHFLSPCGPVFKLIYTLLRDPSAKYDFPIIYLPSKVVQILDNANIHPFYADLVHLNPQTKKPVSLLLNPFDYYMFHFAYHLINSFHQRAYISNTTANWNTVYYCLCCDYMLHFFPTDPSTPVLPTIYYNGKNPMDMVLSQNSNYFTPNNKSPYQSKLINTSILNQSMEDYTLHQNFCRHPRNDIWRSETVLTVFIDMWLNNDQVSRSSTFSTSLNSSQMHGILQYGELPSGEYMRIVRVLMKQLHAFVASADFDDTHMCELKKVAIPMLQGKFYIFIRNLIHRWPLDGSFRLLLELWLTYIQPWRYKVDKDQKTLMSKQTLETDDVVTGSSPEAIHEKYLPFIAENLLIYVVIFQQLLPRFTRVDLISPKMSVMLYRISKVFNQSNLGQLLQEMERHVENNHSPTHSYSNHWSSNLPPLNPTSNWCSNTTNNLSSSNWNYSPNQSLNMSITSLVGDRKWSAIIKQKIFELEGPTFYYRPLFSQPPAQEVYDLIYQIKKSIHVSQELVHLKQAEENEYNSGFWGFIKSLWTVPMINDEFTMSERMKVPAYLETSLQNLMELFHIVDIPNPELDRSTQLTNGNNFELNDSFKFLTPERVRERVKKIKYEGDPDLHPIRSNEVAFLVRMFYQIATKINEKYGHQFVMWYNRPNYLGSVARQFLCSPIVVYKYDKTQPGSPRVCSTLQPRISLRPFANYSFVGYFVTGGVLAKYFGYSVMSYLLILLLFTVFYKCIKAVFNMPHRRENYPTQGFGNISFDDSF